MLDIGLLHEAAIGAAATLSGLCAGFLGPTLLVLMLLRLVVVPVDVVRGFFLPMFCARLRAPDDSRGVSRPLLLIVNRCLCSSKPFPVWLGR